MMRPARTTTASPSTARLALAYQPRPGLDEALIALESETIDPIAALEAVCIDHALSGAQMEGVLAMLEQFGRHVLFTDPAHQAWFVKAQVEGKQQMLRRARAKIMDLSGDVVVDRDAMASVVGRARLARTGLEDCAAMACEQGDAEADLLLAMKEVGLVFLTWPWVMGRGDEALRQLAGFLRKANDALSQTTQWQGPLLGLDGFMGLQVGHRCRAGSAGLCASDTDLQTRPLTITNLQLGVGDKGIGLTVLTHEWAHGLDRWLREPCLDRDSLGSDYFPFYGWKTARPLTRGRTRHDGKDGSLAVLAQESALFHELGPRLHWGDVHPNELVQACRLQNEHWYRADDLVDMREVIATRAAPRGRHQLQPLVARILARQEAMAPIGVGNGEGQAWSDQDFRTLKAVMMVARVAVEEALTRRQRATRNSLWAIAWRLVRADALVQRWQKRYNWTTPTELLARSFEDYAQYRQVDPCWVDQGILPLMAHERQRMAVAWSDFLAILAPAWEAARTQRQAYLAQMLICQQDREAAAAQEIEDLCLAGGLSAETGAEALTQKQALETCEASAAQTIGRPEH